jgi:hypothetical protein
MYAYHFLVCLQYHVPCLSTISFQSLFTVSCSMYAYHILSKSVYCIMFHVCLTYHFLVCLQNLVPCLSTISFQSLFTASCSMCAYHISSYSVYNIMFHVYLPYPFRVCLLYHVPCMPTISFPLLFTISCSMVACHKVFLVYVPYFCLQSVIHIYSSQPAYNRFFSSLAYHVLPPPYSLCCVLGLPAISCSKLLRDILFLSACPSNNTVSRF